MHCAVSAKDAAKNSGDDVAYADAVEEIRVLEAKARGWLRVYNETSAGPVRTAPVLRTPRIRHRVAGQRQRSTRRTRATRAGPSDDPSEPPRPLTRGHQGTLR